MRGIALSLAMVGLFFSLGAAADGSPLPSEGFRLSGGVAVEGNKVTVNALANGTGTITVNRVTWSAGGTVPDGHAGFKNLAPYGGLGYTQSFDHGFEVSWDGGALFGALPMLPRVTLPGLPEDLALQNDYIESHLHTQAIQPLTEVTFGVRF